MTLQQNLTYSTYNELKFLEGLGTYSISPKVSRLQLLRNYKRAMDLRVDWTGINRFTCYMRVTEMIKKEEGR